MEALFNPTVDKIKQYERRAQRNAAPINLTIVNSQDLNWNQLKQQKEFAAIKDLKEIFTGRIAQKQQAEARTSQSPPEKNTESPKAHGRLSMILKCKDYGYEKNLEMQTVYPEASPSKDTQAASPLRQIRTNGGIQKNDNLYFTEVEKERLRKLQQELAGAASSSRPFRVSLSRMATKTLTDFEKSHDVVRRRLPHSMKIEEREAEVRR